MNKLLMILGLTYAGMAMACPSQIITMPDGRTMVCFYCNDGKIVNCEYL